MRSHRTWFHIQHIQHDKPHIRNICPFILKIIPYPLSILVCLSHQVWFLWFLLVNTTLFLLISHETAGKHYILIIPSIDILWYINIPLRCILIVSCFPQIFHIILMVPVNPILIPYVSHVIPCSPHTIP